MQESGKMNVDFFRQLENKLPEKKRKELEMQKERLLEDAQAKLPKKDLEIATLRKN
jgi:hypothetical protein